ncbi:MAG TPA: hypothetical protein VHR47_02740 [Bacillota bacterium]|nr:hypothetical protein [Bacillota bacterium]
MSGRIFRTASVAMIFMGTVIGAGFASGQEISYFFTRHGIMGAWGVLISAVFLGVFGAKFMLWGRTYRAGSYRMLFSLATGPRLGGIGDLFVTIVLLVLAGVMVAGAGALIEEIGGLWIVGVGITALLCIVVLNFRLSGIRGFNLLVIPLLIGTGVIVAGTSFFLTPHLKSVEAVKGWPFSALLYSGYNLLLALPVLVAVHQLEPDERILRWGGWIGGLGLGLTALLFHLALLRTPNGLFQSELPLFPILARWGGWARGIYAFVLWGELFTTYIANIYGLVQRWGEIRSPSYRWRLILVVIASILIGQFGFAPLIQKVYPIFGLFSLLLLVYLFFKLTPVIPEKGVKVLETPEKL